MWSSSNSPPEGRATAEKIPAVLCQVQNACLRGFERAELDTSAGRLNRVLGNVREVPAEREGVGEQA